MESSSSFILRNRSIPIHSNPVFVNTCTPPSPMMYCDDGHILVLKIRVYIWKRMDVVTVEYGIFSRKFHLTM